MTDKRTYWIGVLLTGLGAVVLSPDALLFRLLESDLWTAAFWRLLLMGLTIMAALVVIRRQQAHRGYSGYWLGPSASINLPDGQQFRVCLCADP